MKFKPAATPGGVTVEAGLPGTPLSSLFGPSEFKVRTILVPLDFSECSQKALQYALPFVKQFQARLSLLHVVQPVIPVPEVTTLNVDEVERELTRQALRQLDKIRESLGGTIASESLVRLGQPAMEIIRAAKESGTDLIILSTHGHTGLVRLFLGSTTERVVRLAGCPVLVVRENEHDFVPAAEPVEVDPKKVGSEEQKRRAP